MERKYWVLKTDSIHPEWAVGQTTPVHMTEADAKAFVTTGTLRLWMPTDDPPQPKPRP